MMQVEMDTANTTRICCVHCDGTGVSAPGVNTPYTGSYCEQCRGGGAYDTTWPDGRTLFTGRLVRDNVTHVRNVPGYILGTDGRHVVAYEQFLKVVPANVARPIDG